MEITKALKEDHDKLKSYLKIMNGDGTASEKKDAFKKLDELLKKHSDAEERVVYNALISTRDEESKVSAHEGYTEHEVAEHVLKALEKEENPDSAKWKAEAKVLRELLEHHIEEEEDEIFSEVKDHFDESHREEMGEKFEKLKRVA